VEFLSWLENTDTVTWIRESTSLLGYTLYLSLHTLGLVLRAGALRHGGGVDVGAPNHADRFERDHSQRLVRK
jgi:hypothetical protein